MTKVPFKTEDLQAGDIISLQTNHTTAQEWSRLYIFEVTKRLLGTVVLLDATGGWTPGDIYNCQIIDLEADKWRLLKYEV
jgi:hypothetical protein